MSASHSKSSSEAQLANFRPEMLQITSWLIFREGPAWCAHCLSLHFFRICRWTLMSSRALSTGCAPSMTQTTSHEMSSIMTSPSHLPSPPLPDSVGNSSIYSSCEPNIILLLLGTVVHVPHYMLLFPFIFNFFLVGQNSYKPCSKIINLQCACDPVQRGHCASAT